MNLEAGDSGLDSLKHILGGIHTITQYLIPFFPGSHTCALAAYFLETISVSYMIQSCPKAYDSFPDSLSSRLAALEIHTNLETRHAKEDANNNLYVIHPAEFANSDG